VRIYAAHEEENLRTLRLLKDWVSEGFITEDQYRTMKADVRCGLRCTNVFLRFVFFLFTLISAVAAAGLVLVGLSIRMDSQSAGFVFLFFGALFYGGAELAVRKQQMYRHGVEEALAALSVLFLCIGLEFAFIDRIHESAAEALPLAIGSLASFLIYCRFGFEYAFGAAMILAAFLPHYWTSSHAAQHLIVAAFYAAGLVVMIVVRRSHRFDFRDDEYSVTEALLWIGIYAALNLQISSVDQLRQGSGVPPNANEFPAFFYWLTYALIWILPGFTLWRGLRRKDRAVIAAALAAAILTLVTNKPYLGWPRHTWDAMLLGILLIGIALAAKRWLSKGPDGIRQGFTARRFSADDKRFRDALSTIGGAMSWSTVSPAGAPAPDVNFGGGESGGGGASSDF
jgi:uncharacterized membrane protein YgcG